MPTIQYSKPEGGAPIKFPVTKTVLADHKLLTEKVETHEKRKAVRIHKSESLVAYVLLTSEELTTLTSALQLGHDV